MLANIIKDVKRDSNCLVKRGWKGRGYGRDRQKEADVCDVWLHKRWQRDRRVTFTRAHAVGKHISWRTVVWVHKDVRSGSWTWCYGCELGCPRAVQNGHVSARSCWHQVSGNAICPLQIRLLVRSFGQSEECFLGGHDPAGPYSHLIVSFACSRGRWSRTGQDPRPNNAQTQSSIQGPDGVISHLTSVSLKLKIQDFFKWADSWQISSDRCARLLKMNEWISLKAPIVNVNTTTLTHHQKWWAHASIIHEREVWPWSTLLLNYCFPPSNDLWKKKLSFIDQINRWIITGDTGDITDNSPSTVRLLRPLGTNRCSFGGGRMKSHSSR